MSINGAKAEAGDAAIAKLAHSVPSQQYKSFLQLY
jgi:hypothetical protein